MKDRCWQIVELRRFIAAASVTGTPGWAYAMTGAVELLEEAWLPEEEQEKVYLLLITTMQAASFQPTLAHDMVATAAADAVTGLLSSMLSYEPTEDANG